MTNSRLWCWRLGFADRFPILAVLDFSMATEFKCDYCTAAVEKNATLVHTERKPGLWDLDYSMCPDCFKPFKAMLEKAKSQKSWAGWTALEQEVDSLKEKIESLKSELQFLRYEDPICRRLMTDDPKNEVVTLVTRGGETLKAHRNILISRSTVIKRQLQQHKNKSIELWNIPRDDNSFRAFIEFLYTAEVDLEILKDHAPELMEAGNKNAIELLKRKCEDYIVENITAENAISYLQVAEQCESTAIRVAAVKQILSNPTGFVNREDFQTLENNTAACFATLRQVLLDSTSETSKGSDSGSVSGSVPSSDSFINSGPPRDQYGASASHMLLGTCTCSVHPFPHSAAPGYGYHGWHFQAATAMPSTAYTVDPASAMDKLQLDQRKS